MLSDLPSNWNVLYNQIIIGYFKDCTLEMMLGENLKKKCYFTLFICFTNSHLSSVEVGGWEEYILCQACLYDSFKDEFCFVLFTE